MFRLGLLLLSLLSTTFAVDTSRRTSNLTAELACVVPACAEDCFISFLDANYGLVRGKGIPSLEELCSTDGDTGFTIGEGAVQCIAAEQRLGACPEKDAGSVISKAYRMCSNQPNAIQPTHGVITATLVVPPSGGGPISYPRPSKTRSRSFTRTGLPSTLVIDTHTPTVTTSDLETTLRTSVVSTTTQAAETSTATGEPAAASSSTGLTPVQKAGISVGVIGFAAVAVGFLLLFRLYRAKKKHGRHTPLSSTPPRRDSWGYRFDKSRGGDSGEPSWMANPVRPPNDSNNGPSAAAVTAATAVGAAAGMRSTAGRTPPPPAAATKSPISRAYNRASWRPSLIGLAISPSHSKHTTQATTTPTPRPISKLLPAKPILALAIPNKPPSPPTKHTPPTGASSGNQTDTPSPEYTRISSQPPVLPKLQIPQRDDFLSVAKTTNKPRESTMTEFEEDGHESSFISPEGQTWGPVSAEPQSAAAYFAANKYSNWTTNEPNRLSQTAELEGTTPLSAHPKLATSVTILPVVNSSRAKQPAATIPDNKRPSHRRSSSAPIPPGPNHQSIRVVTEPLFRLSDAQQDAIPRPLFSSPPSNPQNMFVKRSSGRNLTRPRAPSTDSGITTISTSSEDDSQLQPPGTTQVNLSPVAESPRSGNGRSPVSYPKIPGRDNGPTGKPRLIPPPRMPILYKSAHHRTASGGIASSAAMPTLGSLSKQAGSAMETEGVAVSAVNASVPAIRPIIPTTMVTAASPHHSAIMSRQKTVQDPTLLRTGSPTMRIVEPSPEPEDDRAALPSARPRSMLGGQQMHRRQTQLQPSPSVVPQQRRQLELVNSHGSEQQSPAIRTSEQPQRLEVQSGIHGLEVMHEQPYGWPHQHPIQPQPQPQPQLLEGVRSQQQGQSHHQGPSQPQTQPQKDVHSEQQVYPRPHKETPQQHQHQVLSQNQDQRQLQIHPQKDHHPQQHQKQQAPYHPQPQQGARPQAQSQTSSHAQPQEAHAQQQQQVQTLPQPQLQPQEAPRPQEHQLNSQAQSQSQPQTQPHAAHPNPQDQTLPQQNPPQPQLQHQLQPEKELVSQPQRIPQQPQTHLQRPEPPPWIPGLPAHPHPRRPQHTSTLWLPPQARKNKQKHTTMETEPDHHSHSPMRPQRQPHPQIPQRQVPQTQPFPPQNHIRRPQQHAYPYPNPRPHPNHQPKHYYPPFYQQQQQQQQQVQQAQYQQPQLPHASLIAKRLGHDRAVNMSISTDHSSSTGTNNWHRGSGGPMYLSPEVVTPRGYPGDLPSTPTWVPRLTPTRRGADLYLNVQ